LTLRDLPSIDRLLQTEEGERLRSRFGHGLSVRALRQALDLARQSIRSGTAAPTETEVLAQARD
jgi:Selenocysteine synthase N terminal